MRWSLFNSSISSSIAMLNARTWAVALLALLVLSVTSAGKGTPQFVPNGRYGRRSVTPPLAGKRRRITRTPRSNESDHRQTSSRSGDVQLLSNIVRYDSEAQKRRST
ncbi:hypothetical protein HPB50_011793 [Hyalomma asiaticum]|uniref:Uncharacterized protein n=1 Tax=Hyalomma asiaticum TaxID=266040 RepID=A0ACB7S8I7_HYAAI|nr:hypothetical protein HPB50_011793 [Hyalomma asiaticum]